MPRIRLDLAYDGTFFSGWAAQPGLRTVEGVLTDALATVLREPVRLTVAGRTDAGVHAAAQVVHLDTSPEAWTALPGRSERSPEAALLTRLAGVLAREAQESLPRTPRGAGDVVVTGARIVPEAFDARFGALSRRYAYRIADAAAPRDPARRATVLWVPDRLDVEAMAASAAPLLGEHDFLSYCKPREGATTIRTLRTLHWRRAETGSDAGLVVLSVVADAFCHSMVRSLVGAGLAVGQGRRPVTWPGELLAARTRDGAAPVAPPHGLTLEEVTYPGDEELAAQAERARTTRRLTC
ncbi:tRNA pseudouridine(38-40) synthase TruA [Actinomyces viscosus]|uniref:tRNA pseudouridine synthase A n=2 Tax=Actinomyces viscosus TaxID=1656 RepID=A0A3S4XBR6_ACTVI|nr:tRNA pseudouridine(38-40) synthase TruA [Actinomyces viscosus]TFH52367.1 tRNA pseudouridine(38-40) synthase TruA [Actinomyces viscosus]VEI18840.1 tRNA pseudouridine synthase A [Actinomyces viscosus]